MFPLILETSSRSILPCPAELLLQYKQQLLFNFQRIICQVLKKTAVPEYAMMGLVGCGKILILRYRFAASDNVLMICDYALPHYGGKSRNFTFPLTVQPCRKPCTVGTNWKFFPSSLPLYLKANIISSPFRITTRLFPILWGQSKSYGSTLLSVLLPTLSRGLGAVGSFWAVVTNTGA